MARFRVGPVRFGGGRRPSVTFGVGPFGATLGGGWHSRESGSSSSSNTSGLYYEGSTGSQPTEWDRLSSLYVLEAEDLTTFRASLWVYSAFAVVTFWLFFITERVGFFSVWGTFQLLSVLLTLAVVNVAYAKWLSPPLSRLLRFGKETQSPKMSLVVWLGVVGLVTLFWGFVPEFRQDSFRVVFEIVPDWIQWFGIPPRVLFDKYALMVISYAILLWQPIRVYFISSRAHMAKELRERYRYLTSIGTFASNDPSATKKAIDEAVSKRIRVCDQLVDLLRSGHYVRRVMWLQPKTPS